MFQGNISRHGIETSQKIAIITQLYILISMDISIKNLKKYIFEPKTESLRLKRANEILSQNMVITEKVDGTKLTLVRTQQVDKVDYTKNWVVAYKGTVLYAKEFAHLGDKEKGDISQSSVGIGQYSMIFDHLAKINNKINSIPKSTEFSVEFAQNKDTLTRTYVNKGGLFLRSYGEVQYRVVGGDLHTIPKQEITDYKSVNKMAELLEISSFPIFFQGKLSKENLLKNPLFGSKLTNVDWSNPTDVVTKFSEAILAVPSTLGGTTEGVVMKLDNGEFFKLVQADQYDAGVRGAKKDAYKLEPEAASAYFQQIRALIQNIFAAIGTEGKSEEDVISDSNFYVAKNQPKLKKFFDSLQKIAGDKKNIVQIKDDIHDTIRLMTSKQGLLGSTGKTLGLIPIAGKPLHIGHWKLIEKAANENDRVIVYTSSSDRIKKGEFPIKGDDFVKLWSDVFIPSLPKNVKVKFVDSPVRAVMHELGWLEQRLTQDAADMPTINLYSDKDDVEINFKDEDLKKYPELLAANKIKKVGVERTATVNVSGTKMREFLMNNDKESFLKNLPPVSNKDKEEIWNTLIKNKPEPVSEVNPYAALAEELIQEETPEAMKNIEKIKRDANLGIELAKQLIREEIALLTESGQSVAAVDDKTSKTVNGQPAQATTKLKIVDPQGKDIRSAVSGDVKELVYALNDKVHFWKKNNPYIENGFVFNGSSQYLMSGDAKYKDLAKYKSGFGDIDVIVPKEKLDTMEAYLDSIDDKQVEWKATPKNKVSKNFYYVGRTKNQRALAGQTVTLWYYAPVKQVVQIDFEGDEMTLDPQGYEKPSEWNKFIKDSPWQDLTTGIKGLAGAILLRGLTRAATALPNAVYVTNSTALKIQSGQLKSLVDAKGKSVVSVNATHALPAEYTLNTSGSGHAGVRKAYRLVAKNMDYQGKKVDVYTDIAASESKPEDRINSVNKVFELIFKRKPSGQDVENFRSYVGLLTLMKTLPKDVQVKALERAKEGLAQAGLEPAEYAPIQKAAKTILGISI